MTKTELRQHLAYSAWASRRSLESCRSAPAELLPRLIEKLEHIFMADRGWLSRVVGRPRSTFRDEGESYNIDSLAAAWEALHAEWAFLSDSADPDSRVPYRTYKGAPLENSMAEIVLHVVNHASYHRGQVSAILREARIQPLSTDFMEYLWTK